MYRKVCDAPDPVIVCHILLASAGDSRWLTTFVPRLQVETERLQSAQMLTTGPAGLLSFFGGTVNLVRIGSSQMLTTFQIPGQKWHPLALKPSQKGRA